jgi:hypothetical protein
VIIFQDMPLELVADKINATEPVEIPIFLSLYSLGESQYE